MLKALIAAVTALCLSCVSTRTIKKALSQEPPELLTVCWPESGMVDFEDQTCEKQRPPAYDHFPLRVKSIGLTEETLEVVRVWNQALGTDALKYSSSPYGLDIAVIYLPLDPKRENLNGEIDWFVTDEGTKCLGTMYRNRPDTLIHEIGHCLGLAHDPDNNRSVMYPSSTGRILPHIEPADIKRLKKLHNL